ncbi:MAG: exodeoxyribonuclease VII large subunit [Clostridia bacterium]|nr:exodeoxyribonuclease VII large subunit [Clostridia bacterium]
MSDRLLTVTQLNEYLKLMMDSNPLLADVFVRGEISNFTNHYKTGHFYFSLKDETGTVRAVMFRSAAQYVTFKPENGMKVILRGRVSVFPRDGQYQIYVNEMQPDGIGALYIAYEQLRRKLEAEGLFEASRKKPLPKIPTVIGLVTSPTGAAVRDMIDVLGRRFPCARVILYPALVQGQGAAESIAAGVQFFNDRLPVDVMIVGRGGGSAEDLWAFNDEMLARTVAASRVPVISAVGHETDVTLCDFVADLRAPTPSAAAELAVPEGTELKNALAAKELHLYNTLLHRFTAARSAVNALSGARSMRSPLAYLDDKRMALFYLTEKLERPVERCLLQNKNRFAALCGKIDSLNPLRVLVRGYAAVFDREGNAVSRVGELAPLKEISVRMADGTFDATVTDVRKGEKV